LTGAKNTSTEQDQLLPPSCRQTQ